MSVTRETALELYYKIILTRFFEEKMVQVYADGEIPGSLHLGIGQEVLSVATAGCLSKDDYLVFSHRGFGHCLAKGMRPGSIMAEFMGKADGCSLGKGGVHLANKELGILGISGSQGGNAPIATGAALAASYAGSKQVAVCYFGDGTSNRGPIHEAMNLAAVWKLPVIFICENNYYGFSTPLSKEIAIDKISDRALAYGMPGVTVNGNHLLEVCQAMTQAIERARVGQGPSLIEGMVHRWRGHHERDLQKYKTPEEFQRAKDECPIITTQKLLKEHFKVDTSIIKELDAKAASEVQDAYDFAFNSPWPAPQKVFSGIYA